MKNMQKVLTLFLLIVLTTFSLSAQDFGIILDQTADFTAHGEEFEDANLYYYGILIPHFTTLIGDTGEVVVSAGLDYEVDPVTFIPELLRTDFTMRFGMGELKVGRMPYSDPLGLIADGLFDGAHFSYDTRAGDISIGAWYTGFLYKERAAIAMTPDERRHGYAPVDYDNFVDSYFAPARALASLGYENDALAGFLNLKLALLGQFDASGADLNSYYFATTFSVPTPHFVLDLGGSVELVDKSQELAVAMAGQIGLTWLPPGKIEQLFSLSALVTSGVVEDSPIGAFLPLTTVQQGNLLCANVSGLSVLSLDYIGRLHRAFSLNVNASYFIRSDLGTYRDYPVLNNESDGFFLGLELFGGFIWNLSSDIQLNLGLGAFLPSLGDAMPEANALWRAQLNVILMVF